MMKNYEILTSLSSLAILQRSGIGISPEFPEKIPHIVVAAIQADFRDGKVAVFQKAHCLADTVFIEIFYWRKFQSFPEKTTEILFIQSYQCCQVTNIYFFLIMFTNIGNRGFYCFNLMIIRCFSLEKKFLCGQNGEDFHQAGSDKELIGRIDRHSTGYPKGSQLKCVICNCEEFRGAAIGKNIYYIKKYFFQAYECRMLLFDASGKMQLAILQGLDYLRLNSVIKWRTEKLRMKHNGIFLYFLGGSGANAVQLSRIDEVKTLGLDSKTFHINFHMEAAAGKVEDFCLFVPMMLYHKAMPCHFRLIKSTGKRLGAMDVVFFQIRGWIVLHSEASLWKRV